MQKMTKLVVKCGDIEVEYDGPEEFLKQELPELIKAIAQLRATPAAKSAAAAATNSSSGAAGSGETSVSTIAQQLSVKNGPDLIMAAALSLARAGAESFTKKQLRDRTRDATTFYRSSYTNNFDNYVG